MSIYNNYGLSDLERNRSLHQIADAQQKQINILRSEIDELKAINRSTTITSVVAIFLSAVSILVTLLCGG